jgi:hypothetical protein
MKIIKKALNKMCIDLMVLLLQLKINMKKMSNEIII